MLQRKKCIRTMITLVMTMLLLISLLPVRASAVNLISIEFYPNADADNSKVLETMPFSGSYHPGEKWDMGDGSYKFTVSLPGTVPKRSGYLFLGWSPEPTPNASDKLGQPGTTYTFIELQSDSYATLYAIWGEAYTYTLEFDANGGQGAPDAITVADGREGHLFIMPQTVPTREGYVFRGWYVGKRYYENGYLYRPGSARRFTDPVSTMYAIWGQYTYTLNFDANGGEGAPGSLSAANVNTTHTFTIPDIAPIHEEKDFLGWATDAAATRAEFAAGGTVTMNGATDMDRPLKSAQTLYAVWGTLRDYTLTYEANGGEGAPAAQTAESADTSCSFTLSDAVPTRQGYQFLGWAASADAAAPDHQPGGSVTVTAAEGDTAASKTLYAVWGLLRSYTLTYEANGGEGAPAAQTAESVDTACSFTLSQTVPTRQGYQFLGWAAAADAAAPDHQPGDSVAVTAAEEAAASKTLYAVWGLLRSYTLTYEANGGEGAPAAQTAESVDTTCSFALPDTVPTKTGHTFSGWTTDVSVPAAAYRPGGTLTMTVTGAQTAAAQTLYAVWYPEVYVLSIPLAEGGTRAEPIVYGQKLTIALDEGSWAAEQVPAGFTETEPGSGVYETTVTDDITLTPANTPTDAVGSERFLLWKSASFGGSQSDASNPAHVLTLQAVWPEYPVGLQYAVGSSTEPVTGMPADDVTNVRRQDPENRSFVYNISDSVPAGTRMQFTGWLGDDGKTYQPGDKLTLAVNQVVTLTAQWKVKEFKVTYTDGVSGKTIFADQTTTVQYGEAAPAFSGTPARKGYTFTGWSPAVAGTVTADAAYTAQWKAKTLEVKFDVNGGNSAHADQDVTFDQPYGKLPKPTHKTMYFAGWYTAKTGGTRITASSIVDQAPDSGVITLYARWSTVPVTGDAVDFARIAGLSAALTLSLAGLTGVAIYKKRREE